MSSSEDTPKPPAEEAAPAGQPAPPNDVTVLGLILVAVTTTGDVLSYSASAGWSCTCTPDPDADLCPHALPRTVNWQQMEANLRAATLTDVLRADGPLTTASIAKRYGVPEGRVAAEAAALVTAGWMNWATGDKGLPALTAGPHALALAPLIAAPEE